MTRSEGTRGEVTAASARLQALEAMAATSFERSTIEADLEHLTAVLCRAAPDLVAVSVTATLGDGSHVTAATTDPDAKAVDEFEYRMQEGPCIAAMRTGEEQLVEDVLDDQRWPDFNAFAAEHGFRSVAGIPLIVRGEGLGALNLFADRPGGLGETDLDQARRLAGPAAVLLANGEAYRRAERSARELREALDDLAEIQQAVGALVATERCSVAEAEQLLEQRAADTGRSVRDAARDLLGGAG